MQQRTLSFARIDAEDARIQRERIAAEIAALPPTPAAVRPLKRPVGRPKRERSPAAARLEAPAPVTEQSNRGHYTKWFASPYINDILDGWQKCCLCLFNVADPEKHVIAVAAVQRKELDQAHVFDEDEEEREEVTASSEDELDVSQPRQFGKQGKRQRTQAKSFGYQLDSQAVAMTEDSD